MEGLFLATVSAILDVLLGFVGPGVLILVLVLVTVLIAILVIVLLVHSLYLQNSCGVTA